MKDDASRHPGTHTVPGDFLIKKTDSHRAGDLMPLPAAEGETPHRIRTGTAFVEGATATMTAMSAFGAMVIGIDPVPDNGGTAGDAPQTTSDTVAAVIDACCRERGGLWGPLENDLYGCVVADLTDDGCKTLAEEIRKTVAATGDASVSIGTAAFPQIGFERGQILDNAGKALAHAAFFGPNTVVAFDAVSLNISGDQCYQAGDISGAIEEYRLALNLDPDNFNVLNSLGVCYGVLGAYEKAIRIFETAMALAPEEAMAVYNTGMAHMLLGDRNRALDFFLEADQIGSAPYEVGVQTGRLYLDLGKPASARPFLEAAVQRQPEAAVAHRYLGECLAAQKQTDAAVAAYKKAIKYNPHDAEALSALGFLFDLIGENPEISTVFCRQSVELAPENGLFRERLGALLLKQNRLEAALDEFFKAEAFGREVRGLIEETRERLTMAAS
jgi:Flp pilus assembly protein TadD